MKKLLMLGLGVAAAAGGLIGTPAQAGYGPSVWCNDGGTAPGGREVPILSSPITLAAEIDPGEVWVCYSTTPQGAPGGITGGAIRVKYAAGSSTVSVTTSMYCVPDSGVNYALTCNSGPNGAAVGSIGYATGTTTFAQSTGGPCLWVMGTQYLSTCTSGMKASYYSGDAPSVSTHSTGVCLVSGGSTCHAWLTGVKVTAGYDSANPLVRIDGPFVNQGVDVPSTCYGVLASCP